MIGPKMLPAPWGDGGGEASGKPYFSNRANLLIVQISEIISDNCEAK
jgi:hypothetical protein